MLGDQRRWHTRVRGVSASGVRGPWSAIEVVREGLMHGLRRQTDIARSIIERTRGDLTLSFRQQQLEKTIRQAEANLLEGNGEDSA